jgi:hypothetical protein
MELCWSRSRWVCTWLAATGAERSSERKDLNNYLRYGFIEDLDTVRHIHLGKFWGIEVSVTPITWLSPLVFFSLGLVLNAPGPRMTLTESLYNAGVFVIGVEISTLIHALGHILGGKLVRSPMNELLLTATRGVNIYFGDQKTLPGFIHLGRAMGGPVFNLLVAGLLLQLQNFVGIGFSADVLASIISTSLFMGVGGFAPLPSVDGEVIWREVFLWLPWRRPRKARNE